LIQLRKARMSDAENIHALINGYATEGLMLPRARNIIYECIREFIIAEEDGEFLGTGALHIIWEDLAEARALAIKKDSRQIGIGRKIVNALIDEARHLEIKRVFALTYQPEFFEKCGFRIVSKDDLPQKVWKECINCPKFPNCDEIALIREV
jgi:amino-acid N-acetyltransferase